MGLVGAPSRARSVPNQSSFWFSFAVAAVKSVLTPALAQFAAGHVKALLPFWPELNIGFDAPNPISVLPIAAELKAADHAVHVNGAAAGQQYRAGGHVIEVVEEGSAGAGSAPAVAELGAGVPAVPAHNLLCRVGARRDAARRKRQERETPRNRFVHKFLP